MSYMALGLWQWLALLQHELLLFAGLFFLVGALDDLGIDALWLWTRASGRVRTPRRSRLALQNRPLSGPVAVVIPAWREAAVIGQTIRTCSKPGRSRPCGSISGATATTPPRWKPAWPPRAAIRA